MAGLRLVEMVGGLSLAADLGTGQSLEHQFRTCLRAMRVADALGLGADERRGVYYLSLLRFIGCTASSDEDVQAVRGDEIRFLAEMAPVFMGSMREMLPAFVRSIGPDLPPLTRAGAVIRALADSGAAERTLGADCEVASRLSSRLGMGERLQRCLLHSFERWDGKGIPGELAGTEIPIEVRITIVARDAELWVEAADPSSATEVLRARRGRAYDPDVVDAILDSGPLEPLQGHPDVWAQVLDAEPLPAMRIDEDDLDGVLEVLADFTDLKSPYTRGHSRAVADLAADAATTLRLDTDVVRLLLRAGLVHDLGRVGIPLSVWDRPDALSVADRERIRLHPYLTERALAPAPSLTEVARVAGAHHERLDGSGYHRGCAAAELDEAQRILAAADSFEAMTRERPHRPALDADAAVAEIRREAADGHLDERAVEAVLDAAGHGGRDVAAWPCGLTDREVEVLRLITSGRTNRQVADELVIAPKTVGSHVEHIYTKIGVSSRAAAAVFAMEHRLR